MSFIQVGILLVFICSFSNGAVLSWEERFAQLETKYYQLEERATQLEKNNEDREELAAQVTELKTKVQQQETILSALLNDRKEPSSYPSEVAVNGLPSSCDDLKMIGHTLNGFYSIVGLKMMESVFCDFSKLPSDPGFQKWIGYSDVKSAPVHFYVQRESNYNQQISPIPFDVAVVNEGYAMNLATGIFTAPRNGIYFFSFTAHAYFLVSSVFSDYVRLGINLVLNDITVGLGWVEEGRLENVNSTVNTQSKPVTIQSTLNLKKDDRVWVRISSLSGEGYLYDASSPYHFTHFTGFMLQEEIVVSL